MYLGESAPRLGSLGASVLVTPTLGSTADIMAKTAIMAAWNQVAAYYPNNATVQAQTAAALKQYNQAVMFQWPSGTAQAAAPPTVPTVPMPNLALYPAPVVAQAVQSIIADTAPRMAAASPAVAQATGMPTTVNSAISPGASVAAPLVPAPAGADGQAPAAPAAPPAPAPVPGTGFVPMASAAHAVAAAAAPAGLPGGPVAAKTPGGGGVGSLLTVSGLAALLTLL